jgi:hypothetical protein
MAPVQVDTPFMQVRQDQHPVGLKRLHIFNHVGKTVVQASLERSAALDGVTLVVHINHIVVVVEKLTFFYLATTPLLYQVVPDFDDFVVIVDVPLSESIQV